MVFDFADAKTQLRRTVHETLGVAAIYEHDSLADPVPIKVRLHGKNKVIGDLDNGDYAQVLEAIEQIVFNEADALAIPVKRGGTITIAKYQNMKLTLEQKEPNDGPYEHRWQVTRA